MDDKVRWVKLTAMPGFDLSLRRAGALAATCAALRVVMFACVLAPVPAAFAAPDVDDPAQRTQITTLDNGLTVLLLPDPATPAVSFQMWVRVGAKDETRFTGLAHLFEHMMFRGTDRLPPESHERMIEARGGRVNAYTTSDVTVYYADVAPDSLPLVIELEAERLRNLKITEETLASERQVVLEERRLRTEDQPDGRAFEALLALTFTAHPYRVPTIGWRSDIEAVTVEACRDFFDTFYAPNNLVIAIAGNFDPADALAQIRRSMGSLRPAAWIPRGPAREPEQRGERRQIVHSTCARRSSPRRGTRPRPATRTRRRSTSRASCSRAAAARACIASSYTSDSRRSAPPAATGSCRRPVSSTPSRACDPTVRSTRSRSCSWTRSRGCAASRSVPPSWPRRSARSRSISSPAWRRRTKWRAASPAST
jgi:hypothetical protein